MKPFHLDVITPGKALFSGDVSSLRAQALDGKIGILADHAPLITLLDKGDLFFEQVSGGEVKIPVSSGILKVEGNAASVFI